MKAPNLLTALGSATTLFGLCACVSLTSVTDPTSPDVEERYDTPNFGELQVGDCSIVYVTNMFRAITDFYENGVYTSSNDEGGTIVSSSVNYFITDRIYGDVGQLGYAMNNLAYSDTMSIPIMFYSDVFTYETLKSYFYFNISNMKIDYPSVSSYQYASIENSVDYSCYYVYFMTLRNRNYDGAVAGALAKSSSTKASVATSMASYNYAADFMAAKGVTMDQISKSPALQSELKSSFQDLQKQANVAIGRTLAKVKVAAVASLGKARVADIGLATEAKLLPAGLQNALTAALQNAESAAK